MGEEIRTTENANDMQICPHIFINFVYPSDTSCEYVEEIKIYCRLCGRTYSFDMLIN